MYQEKAYFRRKLFMRYERYEYRTERLSLFYEFISEGPKGQIKKVVEYTPATIPNVYNLAFGDYDEIIEGINDKTITNNGDSSFDCLCVHRKIHGSLDLCDWKYSSSNTPIPNGTN